MYVKSARNCGDSWNQHLAVLAAMDKYGYARTIDPDSADKASNRISKLYGSMPKQDEGFMRGHQEGEILTVDCWIAEKVKLRYGS